MDLLELVFQMVLSYRGDALSCSQRAASALDLAISPAPFHLLFKIYLNLFLMVIFVYRCFAFMYVRAPHLWLMPGEIGKGHLIELESQM